VNPVLDILDFQKRAEFENQPDATGFITKKLTSAPSTIFLPSGI
jgi:hypothetical protein